jgi:hypothetical protein
MKTTAVLLLTLLAAGNALAAGWQKPYFGATAPGSWARYTMKVEGQPDMDYRSTRLPDAGSRQRLEIRVEYMLEGKLTPSTTRYTLREGYALEGDALGFGKAVVGMSARQKGAREQPMPESTLAGVRATMPDYVASAQLVGTDNVGGIVADHYRYVNRYPGSPAQIETGELWLSATVPFGLVKQKAVTKEETGKAISSFEMLLVDSGVAPAAVAEAKPAATTAPAAKAPAASTGPVPLADAYAKGKVELAVTVVDGDDGRNVRVGFRNKTDAPLRLAIPAGGTVLDVGIPVDKLRLTAAAAKTLELAPAATSTPVEFTQTGQRRPIAGKFAISTYEGTPLFSGSVTMGTVK